MQTSLRQQIALGAVCTTLLLTSTAVAQDDPADNLTSDDPVMVAQAIEALGVQADRQAVRALTARIEAGLPRPLLMRAIAALEATGRSDAVHALSLLTQHRNAQVRGRAAHGLGSIGSSTAQRVLADLLDDPDASVRAEAAVAIGHVGPRQAMEQLISAAVRGLAEAGIVVGQHGNPIAARRLARALTADNLPALAPAVRLLLVRSDVGDPARREIAERLGAIPGNAVARLLQEVDASLPAADRIHEAIAEALIANADLSAAPQAGEGDGSP